MEHLDKCFFYAMTRSLYPSTAIYPDMWKLVNVIPIFKKGDTQLIKNYRPISLLHICSKMFKKLFLPIFTTTLLHITIWIRPADSTTNQLIDLVNDTRHAFDRTKSLEVRAIFLDISKAFEVWHDGLIFKMRQTGIFSWLIKVVTTPRNLEYPHGY